MMNKQYFSLATSYITEISFPQMSTLANVIVLLVQHIFGRLTLPRDASICRFKKSREIVI